MEESVGFGLRIAQFPATHSAPDVNRVGRRRSYKFPVTHSAANKSHALGLKVLMGAPNIVRAGPHSGNIAADLVKKSVLDILSSDYYPARLLAAV